MNDSEVQPVQRDEECDIREDRVSTPISTGRKPTSIPAKKKSNKKNYQKIFVDQDAVTQAPSETA